MLLRKLVFGAVRPSQRALAVCDPYGQDGVPLSAAVARGMARHVPDWRLDEEDARAIRCRVVFDSFHAAADFVNKVGSVGVNGNHPVHALRLESNTPCQGVALVDLECHTPLLKGLSHHDFLLAVKVDTVRREMEQHVLDVSSHLRRHDSDDSVREQRRWRRRIAQLAQQRRSVRAE
ncbi:MAG: hypothetical protein MHM6MM_000710 [Cercozoa sp. M6MM]